jgi:hypothetical protein
VLLLSLVHLKFLRDLSARGEVSRSHLTPSLFLPLRRAFWAHSCGISSPRSTSHGISAPWSWIASASS